VLRYILQAKQRGIGVIFITHNPHHAYPVGDHFVILRRGQVFGDFAKEDLGLEQLVQMMAGGEELQNLAHELERAAGKDEAGDELARAAEALEAEARAAEVPGVEVAEPPAVSEAEVAGADAAAAEADVANAESSAADFPAADSPDTGPSDTRPGG
jgi:ABC-type sugar transport system ATPase subunit